MALTTTTLIKARLWGNEPTQGDGFDTLLGTLITEATGRIEAELGYAVEDAAYTDYLDGTDTAELFLPSGPLVSVTQVDLISHAESDTTTLLDAWRYVLRGTAASGHKGRGWLQRVDGSTFECGKHFQWKVQHTSGWVTVPADVQALATWIVCAEYEAREAAGMLSLVVGDTSKQFITPERYAEQIRRVLEPYRAVVLA